MKICNVIFRTFLGFLIVLGLLCFYNVKKTSEWLEKRLLEKFEINLILKESKDTTKIVDYLEEVIGKYNNINFNEKRLVTKKDIWRLVAEKEELKYFSTLITRNPFPNIFKLKLASFHTQNVLLLFEEFKTNNLIKEVVYDANIFSYLDRLTNTKKYFVFISIVILLLGMFIISFSVYEVYKIKRYFVMESLILFFGVVVVGMINYKVLKGISMQFNFGIQDIIIYGIITIISMGIINSYKKDEK